MQRYYFVKKPLYGIAAGRVERFADHAAGRHLLAGAIEPFDERRHADAPGAPTLVGAVPERKVGAKSK